MLGRSKYFAFQVFFEDGPSKKLMKRKARKRQTECLF